MALVPENENRWAFLIKRFVLMFAVMLPVVFASDLQTGLSIAFWSAAITTVFIAIYVCIGDAGDGRLALWQWPTRSTCKEPPKNRREDVFEKQVEWATQKQRYIDEKNWRGLAQVSRQWVAVAPMSFSAFCSLGLAHGKLREHEPARDAFFAAVRIDSHDASAWYNLGVAHENLNEYAKAFMAYQHAVRNNPAHGDATQRVRAMQEKIRAREANGSRAYREAEYSQGKETGKWYEILGVPEDASVDQVKGAYRKLMQEYHPDRVASLGTALRDLAELKTKEITAAFREFEQTTRQ